MKKGMNPEAVEQMSQNIESAGEDAMIAFKEVAGRVESLDWTGDDRERFVAEFNGALQDLALKVQQSCTEFAERGKRNATDQRQRSA